MVPLHYTTAARRGSSIMAIRKQKGLTLLAVIAAILVGIIIAIGILIWSSSELALANRCQTNLGVLQRHYDSWAQACAMARRFRSSSPRGPRALREARSPTPRSGTSSIRLSP